MMLIVLATAMVVSMLVIPFMWRLAPRFGLMDEPDPRKVHAVPIARVGGWGIVLGAVTPIMLWAEMTPLVQSYLLGVLALFVFGTADDRSDIGHWGKFVGQFLAVGSVVWYGGLCIERVPFFGVDVLPREVGIPFTVFALVGVINALNHSDGLDGLAGGEALLSLLVVAALGHMAGGEIILIIAVATIGGILGFLRYNTHPAKVFMGDSGSQFLGFTLGFLVVLLTQEVNPALSPALPALILGLPIVDILAVLVQRIHHKLNWFEATRNHIHHRLLDLGFGHYETVVAIYSIQALLVTAALFTQYKSDALVLGIYFLVCGGLFTYLIVAERLGVTHQADGRGVLLTSAVGWVKEHHLLTTGPSAALGVLIPLYLIVCGFGVEEVPRDFGIMSAVLLGIMLVEVLLGRGIATVVVRAGIYATVTFTVYLEVNYPSSWQATLGSLELLGLAVLAGLVWLAVRYSKSEQFRTTPTDYLVLFAVGTMAIFASGFFVEADMGRLLIRLMVLLYGCEVLIGEMRRRWCPLSVSALMTLGVLAVRGLL